MAAKKPASEIMTVQQLSEYLQCHHSTIYRLLRNGELPAFRLGGDWRFLKDEIDRWCREKEKTGAGSQ